MEQDMKPFNSDKEELSEQNRPENGESERRVYARSMQIAYCATLILLAIMEIVSACLDQFRIELMVIFAGITGAYNTAMGVSHIKSRLVFLICGICLDICCLAFLTIWILRMGGVNI